jgi:tetratricopeptide (TPR) repeat protein
VQKRVWVGIGLVVVTAWGALAVQPPSAQAQGLVPHTLQLDQTKVERQGKVLLEEARQLAQLQQYDLALPRAALATQILPKSEEAWLLLAGLQLQAEEVVDGISSLKQAQNLNGKNANVLFALGSAHSQKKDYSQAVTYFRQGLALKSDKVPGVYFELGNAYLKLEKIPESIKQFELAVSQDKKFWPALNNIGLIQYEQGKVEAAIDRWKASVAIDPKEAEPQLALAVAIYTKGDREQGFKLAEQALRLNTKYANLDYLKDQLWGTRLLRDAQKLLETPRIKDSVLRARFDADPAQEAPPPPPARP